MPARRLVSPTYSEATLLPSESPGSNHDVGIVLWSPMVWLTAMASPKARPSPRRTARNPRGRVREDDSRIASHLVEPSASAPSFRSLGTRMKSSRQIAEVIGMIMMVRTTRPGGSPPRRISREDRQRSERRRLDPRLEVVPYPGPEDEDAHRPSTTLGIAASSSTIVAIGAASRRGEISVRKRAIAIESGVAIASAISEVTTVP